MAYAPLDPNAYVRSLIQQQLADAAAAEGQSSPAAQSSVPFTSGGGGGRPSGPGSFQKVPFATRPIDSGSINDKSKSKGPDTGGGPPSFEDYLASLGLNSGSFSANLPNAPDLTGAVKNQYGGVLDYLCKGIGRTEKRGEQRDEDLQQIYHAMAGLSQKSGKKIPKSKLRSYMDVVDAARYLKRLSKRVNHDPDYAPE